MDLKTCFVLLLMFFFEVLHCEAQNDTHTHRRKRLIFGQKKKWKAWPQGEIHYCWDPSLSQKYISMYTAAMDAYERHTCVDFKYHASCSTIKGGGVKIAHGSSALSFRGRKWSLQVANLFNTYNLVCHELFHVIGGDHEMNNYMSIAIAPQILGNVIPGYRRAWKPSYSEKDATSEKIIYTPYFDLGSPALYSQYSTTENGFPVYDLMYPDLFHNRGWRVFLGQISSEINTFYRCWDLRSCGQRPTCEFEGYPGYYDKQCGCVCPRGLESSSGCTTIKTKPTSGSWPDTDLKILKTTSGCPAGMTESTAVVTGVAGLTTSSDYNLATSLSGDTLTIYTCSKTGAGNTQVWDHGMNGFLVGTKCPSELQTGNLKFYDSHGATEGDLVFCLQQGLVEEPLMGLPTTDEFAVFSRTSTCQEIDGFVAHSDSFTIKHPSVRRTGDLPRYGRPSDGYSLYYCVYKPLTYNCGGVIKLSAANPSTVISSPNYPATYPQNTECNWFIEVEEGAKIKAEFVAFDVDDADSFDYRRYILKSVPTRVKGQTLPGNIVSIYNRMALRLLTGSFGSQGTGFQINVTRLGAEDYCYSLSDKGESYDGDWNYAIDGTKCLPWNLRLDNNLTISGFADYEGSMNTFLTGSACRNPQGKLHKPACLTFAKEGNFSMRYCDVCHNEYGLRDVYSDCDKAVTADPEVCTGVTAGKCLKTCATRGLVPARSTPPKVGDVTCPQPTLPSDATLEPATSKSVYHPGDKVQLKCTSKKQVSLTCLSSGNWSEWNEPCQGCPAGWAEYSGRCWKLTGREETWLKARIYCKHYYSAYLPMIKTHAEHDFFLEWRKQFGPNMKWWLYGRFFMSAWRWSYDGSKLSADETTSSFGSPKDTNWGKQCVIHNTGTTWNSERCNIQANFMCQKPLIGSPMTCTDRKQECSTLLKDNPLACTDPVVKTNVCPYTCGADVCKTSGNECPNIPTHANAAMVVTKTSLAPGDFVQYKCDSGYELMTGSLTRACLRTGELSGCEPVCVVSGTAITSVNDFPMGMYQYTTGIGQTYTGESKQFAIDRDGHVYSWQVYCSNDGEIWMQVWRPVEPKKYKLIDQTKVQCYAGIARDVTLNNNERIPVQKGDLLGFFDATGNIATFYYCNSHEMPQYAKVHSFGAWPYQMQPGAEISFGGNWCRMFAINAKVGP